MTALDTLLERNQEFAAHQFFKDLSMMPRLRTMIIGCVDPRVDPAHVFGLGPGEVIVIRNVGGRVTPGTLQLLSMLLQVPTGSRAPADNNTSTPFHLIVLHHTDCGITRLARNTELMVDYFAVPPAELPAKAIEDPRAAVASDIATLRAIPDVPSALLVSGLVYDTETGLIDVVVPPAPIRPEQQQS
jgi:carbonic anhydrase